MADTIGKIPPQRNPQFDGGSLWFFLPRLPKGGEVESFAASLKIHALD